MRLAILAVAAVFALSACAAASTASLNNILPTKDTPQIEPPIWEGPLEGGETIATALAIASLPYDDTGDTSNNIHDYDEVCPYTGSLSPDVVYKYTPTSTIMLDIYTCNSGYDTKLYVYENSYTPGAPYACNDDSSLCSGPAYRSYIDDMWAYAGNTYYIVVDGYGSDYGAYEFHVREVVPPPVCDPLICPPGAMQEGEVDCYDNYVDNYNGGCNSTPYVFQNIPLNTTLCGTSGNYMVGASQYRDMDWFLLTLSVPKTVVVGLCPSFPGRTWVATYPCPPTVVVSAACPQNAWTSSTVNLAAGTHILIVSMDGWISWPCGADYIFTVYEWGFVPVENTTWGTVKALYR